VSHTCARSRWPPSTRSLCSSTALQSLRRRSARTGRATRKRPRQAPSTANGGSSGTTPSKLLAGAEHHPTLVPLAASFAAWDVPEPAAYNTLRSLLLNSNPHGPERTRRRDVELEKLSETVASAYAKFGKTADAGTSGESAAASDWKEIDLRLLFGVDIPPPELIHDMLPAGWVDTIWASAFNAAAPPDYVANAMIVAAAGAIGNARTIAARPGWKEVSVLWGALIGPPSAHKTPAMNDAHEALTAIDKARCAMAVRVRQDRGRLRDRTRASFSEKEGQKAGETAAAAAFIRRHNARKTYYQHGRQPARRLRFFRRARLLVRILRPLLRRRRLLGLARFF
jgi:Protein of unknown function (DUF3987)